MVRRFLVPTCLVPARAIAFLLGTTSLLAACNKAPSLGSPLGGLPALTGISPTSGVPGTEVTIAGRDLGYASAASFSVQMDGTTIAGAVRTADDRIVFPMPAQMAPGTVSVTVGGLQLTSPTVVSPIASVSLGMSRVDTFQPGGEVHFAVQAFDVTGAPIADPTVPLAIAGGPADFGTITASESFQALYAPGTATVVAGAGKVADSCVVTTHPVNQADALAAGLMALPATDSYPNYYPASDPYSAPKVALGKLLFSDANMAGGQVKLSCASCHMEAFGMEQGLAQSTTNQAGILQRRKTPTALNSGFMGAGAKGVVFPTSVFFTWDGRLHSLEDQIAGVFNGPQEIAMTSTASVNAYLQGSQSYVTAFDDAYGPFAADSRGCSGPSCATLDNAIAALATYERSLVTPDASFDQWVSAPVGSNPNHAMSASALVGLGVFIGSGHCAACHNGPDFSDDQFHADGAGIPPGVVDAGRGAIDGIAAHDGAFKTPSLRNVAMRAPYFHAGLDADGRPVTDLVGVVRHYEIASTRPGLDPLLPKDFAPDPGQVRGLVDFLDALTGATPSVLS